MILQNITSIEDISKYPAPLARALEYLKNTDFSTLEDGEYEIQERDIWARVFHVTGKDINDTHPEYHVDYIDVQYWIEGGELMGWCPRREMDYDLVSCEDDLYLLRHTQDDEILIPCHQGDFCILMPGDIHRPAIARSGVGEYRKVVIKVRSSLGKL